MLSIVCFELLPEAILISQPAAVLGVLLGAGLMLAVHIHASGASSRATGLMLCLGVAMHNLPEGLAVGAGFQDAPILGLTLAGCIIAHDFPEGLTMAVSLKQGHMPRLRIIGLAALAGLPGIIGTLAGYWIGAAAPFALSFCLALAAGAMLQITCQHLLPQARQESAAPWVTFCLSVGVLGGALLTHWI
ncbi:MAG: ZIP family metal transporter [Clostridia bacterium]|nr:ZIP family metal transporter [Clostridia bacterium]